MSASVRILMTFVVAVSLTCLGLSGTADAYPRLQLDIEGGVYDSVTETVVATSDPFMLYAFATPSGNQTVSDIVDGTNFYLSIALTPQTDTAGDYGYFEIDGVQVDVTSDMTYGTPPIPIVSSSDDLPSHGIFETYFAQFAVDFTSGDQVTPYDTQLNPGASLFDTSGLGMYYEGFLIDMTNMNPDYGLHFDLYALADDGTIDYKAPFSHDAGGPPVVPEPATFLLLGSGMAALAMFRRKQGDS